MDNLIDDDGLACELVRCKWCKKLCDECKCGGD